MKRDAASLFVSRRSSGRCWSSDTYNPVPGVMEVTCIASAHQDSIASRLNNPQNVPASRDYTGGFGVTLMRKDLGLAADAAASVGAALPTGSQALEVYNTMSDSEYVCCGRRWLVVALCHGCGLIGCVGSGLHPRTFLVSTSTLTR